MALREHSSPGVSSLHLFPVIPARFTAVTRDIAAPWSLGTARRLRSALVSVDLVFSPQSNYHPPLLLFGLYVSQIAWFHFICTVLDKLPPNDSRGLSARAPRDERTGHPESLQHR